MSPKVAETRLLAKIHLLFKGFFIFFLGVGLRRACQLLKELLQVHQAREALAELGAAYCKGKWQSPDIPVLGAELCLGKKGFEHI